MSGALMRVATASLLAALAFAARAEIVDDLYSAKVSVTDRSAAALSRASGEALSEVLVKVSGSVEILENTVVIEALPQARQQVQQYGYSRDPLNRGDLLARFEFEGGYISRLITQAKAPLWTANRPRVLVWMVVERNGSQQFVNMDDTPELAVQLMNEFERRGVPAQFPLFDLTDATAIGVDEVWDMQGTALHSASERYDVEDILAGRVVYLNSGSWTGDWSYIHQQHRLDRSISAPDSSGFAVQGVALVAEEMAARYAVAPSGESNDMVRVTVVGVYDYPDYIAIVSWLESLELIEHANVQSIRADRIELGLVSRADAAQLATIIELNERLQPQPADIDELSYQWQE